MKPIELHDSEEGDILDNTNVDDKHEESDNTNSDHNMDDGVTSSSSLLNYESLDLLSDKQKTKKERKVCSNSTRSILEKDLNNQSYDTLQVQNKSKIQAVTIGTSEN